MSRLSRLMRTRLYARARNVINSPDKRQSKMFNFGIDKSKEVCYSVLSKTNSTERRNTKMMKAKALNLKNMKEALVNYSGDQKELEKIWDGLHQMACLGFITQDTWRKFYEECKGWFVTTDGAEVRDSEQGDAVIWTYTGEAQYKA